MSKKISTQTIAFAIIILVAFLGIAALLLSQSKTTVKSPNTNSNLNSGILKISTSFYPLEFLAKEIGGSLAVVTNITPAGTEPHEYEPTPQQIIAIGQSDLLLVNGAGLESWSAKITQGEIAPKAVVKLTKPFELSEIEEQGKKVQDPHIWLSPANYIKMARYVSQSMQQNQNEANQAIIQINTGSLIKKLEILSNNYKTKLNPTNCKINKFVTNHDAFNYLAKDYGLEALSISGLSPEAEPTSKELAELAEVIKSNNIKYVLTETVASPKLADTLAKEVGITTLELNPLEGLTSDEISNGKNYISVMEENLKNLALALDCK